MRYLKMPKNTCPMKCLRLTGPMIVLLLLPACGESKKEANSPQGADAAVEETPYGDESNASPAQQGDYSALYALGESCKLTPGQLAEALDLEAGQVEEKGNYQGNCTYAVTEPGGLTIQYQVGNERWPQDIVLDNIRTARESDLYDIRMSDSGDTYITRHPAQGFLLLLNPEYANPVKISFNYFNPDGPKLTEAQMAQRRENTYKIANYLIESYQK